MAPPTPSPTPTQSDPEQVSTQTQTQHEINHPQVSSLMPIIALIMRVITLASLIVSISTIASDSAKINTQVTVHFNDIYSYRYVVATCAIGIAYTLLPLSFLIYQVSSGKRVSNHPKLLIFELLGDKVVLSLLATGVGAGFGTTLDLMKNMDDFEDALEDYLGDTTFSSVRVKLDDFFNRAYIPTIFLLIAFITSGVSSVLSSLALAKKTQ